MNRQNKFFLKILLVALIAGVLCHNSMVEPLQALEKKPASSNKENHSPIAYHNRPKHIELSGTLQSDQCFSVFLHPGERVVDLLVRQGQRVKQNETVARLANDNLVGRLAVLKEKALELDRSRDHMDVLALKIQVAEKTISRLEGQIEKEKAVKQRVPEYLVEGKLKEWLEVKQQKLDELSVLKKEMSQYRARQSLYITVHDLVKDQVATVEDELNRLIITAPFAGTVTRVPIAHRRMAPKDLVLEICDQQALVVVAQAWQHQILHIKTGARAKIYPNYFNGQAIMGTVRSLSKSQIKDSGNRFPLFPVMISLDQSSPDLLAGMSVAVEIDVPAKP